MDEKELIQLCKKRNAIGQKMLYGKYAPILKGICVRYLKNKEDVSDALQEAFVEIFKSIDGYKDLGSFEGWMKRIMITNCIDLLRKRKRNQLESLDEQDDVSDSELDEKEYLKLLDLPNYQELLLDVLNHLPEILTQVFNLYYIDDLSHKEIATILEINEVTSRTRLDRARKLVKSELAKLLNFQHI
jgi:RNA polymerase sigma-70 factor (ECF subfamily)